MNLNHDSSSIIVTVITAAGAIISTYIVARAKQLNPRSKDHIDRRVDAYENIIKRLETDCARRDRIIEEKDISLSKLNTENNYLRALLANRSVSLSESDPRK